MLTEFAATHIKEKECSYPPSTYATGHPNQTFVFTLKILAFLFLGDSRLFTTTSR